MFNEFTTNDHIIYESTFYDGLARETTAWRNLQGEGLFCNFKSKNCQRPTEVGPDDKIILIKTERLGNGQPKCSNCNTINTLCWRGKRWQIM
ncbi:3238_t:CDS:2 [Diversispora eburnea]|uniref:3238_t:CDS:1 n=1 Tax=Diversispora eburnea TaxID=1213867 RepID=A0A9N8ZML4_9GLOM|nr:3238_t:CDS:2 [Diversispora eburnea]